MPQKSPNLRKLLLPYAKQRLWLALSQDQRRVIGKGMTIREAVAAARRKRIRHPVLIQALRDYSGFVPAAR